MHTQGFQLPPVHRHVRLSCQDQVEDPADRLLVHRAGGRLVQETVRGCPGPGIPMGVEPVELGIDDQVLARKVPGQRGRARGLGRILAPGRGVAIEPMPPDKPDHHDDRQDDDNSSAPASFSWRDPLCQESAVSCSWILGPGLPARAGKPPNAPRCARLRRANADHPLLRCAGPGARTEPARSATSRMPRPAGVPWR